MPACAGMAGVGGQRLEDGPWLIGCRIDTGKLADTTERDPARIRDQFMRGLGVKK